MNGINVRKAIAAEASRIADFNRKMALETEGLALNETTVMAGVVALMGHPEHGFYLVAEMDGTMVGCIKVGYEWTAWRNGTFWWIGSCYVRPEYRGRGVYAALYETLQRMAAIEGNVRGFRLYAHKDNAQTHDVFRGLGMSNKDFVVFEDML
ncbi:MAG: GNAT family N-acetyltransferase [Spartobacteria bacterium]|nr:GNAT family N-acetyltransferase [Spartobacteria bacterium]